MQIATAVGPCGNNRDYIFLLEKALFDIGNLRFSIPSQFGFEIEILVRVVNGLLHLNTGHEDDYIIEIANEVRKVLASITGLLKENIVPLKSSLSPLKMKALPEAIAMDS